jgi:hypothetical protein
MNRNFPGIGRVMALALGGIIVFPSLASSQTAPPMGGGYKDVIPIPVDDPATKAIAGALFKPARSTTCSPKASPPWSSILSLRA